MKEAATEILNRIAAAVPVKWDRLVEDGPTLSVYGWIERPCEVCNGAGFTELGVQGRCGACARTGVDRRADFVLVRAEPFSDEGGLLLTYFTSSSEHSKAIALAIWGELAEDVHVECQRVEDVLPGVEAAIAL